MGCFFRCTIGTSDSGQHRRPVYLAPTTINGERYIDGGVRSMLNADLAIGSDIVIAVPCFR
jgi:hypothetical protein